VNDVSRRGFLKAVGIVSAGALIIPSFSLISPYASAPGLLGSVRELLAYDITWDRHLVRFDLLANGPNWEQLGVDLRLYARTAEELMVELQQAREMAGTVLHDHMEHIGIKPSVLRRLPIPSGYVEPGWVWEMNRMAVA